MNIQIPALLLLELRKSVYATDFDIYLIPTKTIKNIAKQSIMQQEVLKSFEPFQHKRQISVLQQQTYDPTITDVMTSLSAVCLCLCSCRMRRKYLQLQIKPIVFVNSAQYYETRAINNINCASCFIPLRCRHYYK